MELSINDKELQNSLNPVLKSGYFISKNSLDVTISSEGIENASNSLYEMMKNKKYSTLTWKQHDLHPKIANEKTIDWIFMIDLLNFSFWSEKDGSERFAILYKEKKCVGYWSLCAVINRAIEEGTPITTPSYYSSESNISDQDIRHIFRS